MHVCADLLKQTGDAASVLMPDGLLLDLFDDLDPLDLGPLDSGMFQRAPEAALLLRTAAA